MKIQRVPIKSLCLVFLLLAGVPAAGGARWRPAGSAATPPGFITRVSVSSDGSEVSRHNWNSSISADGSVVSFESFAPDLVPNDTNESNDIFVHDRITGRTSRVSVSSDGAQATAASWDSALSANGRYVAFMSEANNLVANDTNQRPDIFVHDRFTGETTLVSLTSDGGQGNDSSLLPSISADGRHVAFLSRATNLAASDTNESDDIFVHDRITGETTRISIASDGTEANNHSDRPAISANGRYVTFMSVADNLVAGDTNEVFDIFVHDRDTGQTSRVSIASNGAQADKDSSEPVISGDGRYVAFASEASTIVVSDTNEVADVFVHDRERGETSRISVASDGTQGNLVSWQASISDNGRQVAFASGASNLSAGDTNGVQDVFIHDRTTGTTALISAAFDGGPGSEQSYQPSISGDGRAISFTSWADNLVTDDTNGSFDIFVYTDAIQIYIPVARR